MRQHIGHEKVGSKTALTHFARLQYPDLMQHMDPFSKPMLQVKTLYVDIKLKIRKGVIILTTFGNRSGQLKRCMALGVSFSIK